MNILLSIKQNIFFNSIVRNIFQSGAKLSFEFFNFLMRRWPVAGVIHCKFYQYNFKYFNNCDDGLLNYFYYDLKYNEEANLKLFIELSKKSKTIIDLGANTGLFSILASRVNSKSNIFAFEPYRANAVRMQVNLNLNAADNVELIHSAVGNTDGKIDITVPNNDSITDVSSINQQFSKSFYPHIVWGTQEVEIQKLDTFAESKNIKIDLIKCDVETYEMLVFDGMNQILKRDRPTIIFESFFDDERRVFFNKIIKDFDYFLYLILDQGVVYCEEGFVPANNGLNYLLSPVVPTKTFIDLSNAEDLCNGLLIRPVS